MRRDDQRLTDIIEAANALGRYLAGKDFSAFVSDEILRDAVVRRLEVIGEAASRLTAALVGRHPEIPWKKIKAFRNFVAHEYFAIKWQIVFDTSTLLVPELKLLAEAVLKSDFPGSGLFS